MSYSMVLNALLKGITISIDNEEYKLFKQGQTITESEEYDIVSSETSIRKRYYGSDGYDHWLPVVESLGGLFELVDKASEEDLAIIAANTTLNKLKRYI